MAAPITGPVVVQNIRNIDAASSYREYKQRYKQPKPYNLVAPYYFEKLYCSYASAGGWGTQEDFPTDSFGGFANVNTGKNPVTYGVSPSMILNSFSDELDAALNSARGEFLEKLGSSAELAVNLAERNQAMRMITSRLQQLARAANTLRKYGPVPFLQELTLDPDANQLKNARKRQKRWTKRKDVANTWLEYHFGWEPLVKDIWSAVDFLQKPIPLGKVSATGRRVPLDTGHVKQTFSGNFFGTYAWTTDINVFRGGIKARIGGDVSVTNPNLFLANRLGLVNPALVAWELIPYSFVVDWFINVGDFLKSYTDGLGISVVNPWTSWVAHVPTATWTNYSTQYGFFVNPDNPSGYRKAIGGYWKSITSNGFYHRRVADIAIVKLQVRPPWRLSASRGATAAALLVQRLKV